MHARPEALGGASSCTCIAHILAAGRGTACLTARGIDRAGSGALLAIVCRRCARSCQGATKERGVRGVLPPTVSSDQEVVFEKHRERSCFQKTTLFVQQHVKPLPAQRWVYSPSLRSRAVRLPPTPCRVCFRPCVFNKISHFWQKNDVQIRPKNKANNERSDAAT